MPLIVAAAVLFARTTIRFRVWRAHRRMPLLLGLTLVALFIWFAENLGTASHAWIYPVQAMGWSMVPVSKLGSWFLLISYIMVAVVLWQRNGDAADKRAQSDGASAFPAAVVGPGEGQGSALDPLMASP